MTPIRSLDSRCHLFNEFGEAHADRRPFPSATAEATHPVHTRSLQWVPACTARDRADIATLSVTMRPRSSLQAFPPTALTRMDSVAGYRPSTRRGIGNRTQCRNLRSKCRCSMCLQFTLVLAASCVLHRPTSRVIHR